MEEMSDNIREIYIDLQKDFFAAIENIKEYIHDKGDSNATEYKLQQLEAEVELSCRWWKENQPCPPADDMLDSYFLPKLQRIWDDYFLLDMMTSNNNYLLSLRNKVRASGRDWSWGEIRKRLESFVSNIALLQLQNDNEAAQQRLEVIYEEQKKYRQQMFLYVLTELRFSGGDIQELEDLLLTPTVDNIDQRMIISALTINGLMVFDPLKLRLLVNVYTKSEDIPVKQYALVGWALTLPRYPYSCDSQTTQIVRDLVDNDATVREELAQLQIQLAYCQSADRDSRNFQETIMPDIMKASNMRFTDKGLEMQEDDPMDDILGRSTTEKKMEEVESRMRSYMDKRSQGMDLFFQGFKHMKRYPFFSDISNWLVPFYYEHPDIAAALHQMGCNGILHLMLDAPMCDNDKYSFVFAFLSIMNKVPKDIIEQMQQTAPPENAYRDWMSDPAILRRNYLQSLYRFFQLFPYSESFVSPFCDTEEVEMPYLDPPSWLIVANKTLMETRFDNNIIDLLKYFLRKKDFGAVQFILDEYNDCDDSFDLCYVRTLFYADSLPDYEDEFLHNIEYCLKVKPDSITLRKLYAKWLYSCEKFQEAKTLFGKLMEEKDGNRNYMFSYALCCHKLGDYDEAKKVLFRLAYEHPDDREVGILLASTLFLDGKTEDAFKRVDKMSADDLDEKVKKELTVVRSLSLLALNRREEAAKCYASSIEISDESAHFHTPLYKKVNDDIQRNLKEYSHRIKELGLDGKPLDIFTHEVYKLVKARG
ncbi:MAG: tetratricopeptide repeat protein [Prevotellaceae bacterium]|nr:tetratricopeptide repeat protein [Prevotellaceae bacterium]MDY5209901.1 tetratricopeptide repeat protein [Prevotella sp.]